MPVCLGTRQRQPLPVLLQPFQLVSGQRRRGQLYKPAQHSGDHATGCICAHVLCRVLVPANAPSRTQAAPLLLPCGSHGALLPAALVCATVLLKGPNNPQWGWTAPVRQWCPVKSEQYFYFNKTI